MRESFRHNQEINELLQKQEELQERLTEEARAREQLALELHRAEGELLWCVLQSGRATLLMKLLHQCCISESINDDSDFMTHQTQLWRCQEP